MIGKTSDCVGVVALLLTVILISSSTSAQPGTIPPPTINTLQVFALPVGQGDCTIIQCPTGNIIVYDCGTSGGARMTPYGVQHWLNNSINNVAYILITHSHGDHHSYLPFIPWNYNNLQGIIVGGQPSDYTGDTANWLNNNLNKVSLVNNGQECIGNNPACVVNTGTNFCNNLNYQFNILAANVGNNPNEKSIVMKVQAPSGWSMLLSGDMEGAAANEIIDQVGAGLQSVVYKMSHHGATRANTAQWISQINPQYAFASSGYNFGICRHPTCDAVTTLLANSSIAMTAAPHHFYCGNGRYLPPTDDANFRYNVLETSPNDTYICLLTYVSDVTIQPVEACFQPESRQTQFTNETTSETAYEVEECDDFTAENGGAVCMAANYFVLATVTLLCFIIV